MQLGGGGWWFGQGVGGLIGYYICALCDSGAYKKW